MGVKRNKSFLSRSLPKNNSGLNPSGREFGKNYDQKKYSRTLSETQKKENKDSIAEFRLISIYEIDNLVESSEFKIITVEKKKFFWTVKEKRTIDIYNDFLKAKTTLLSSIDGTGFLVFTDMNRLLKQKGINLNTGLYNSSKEKFETREESAIFINFRTATKIIEQLDNLNVTDDELKKAYIEKLAAFNSNLYKNQRAEIEKLKQALQKVERNSLLFIRDKEWWIGI